MRAVSTAAAQEASKAISYTIPAGPLSQALTAFGRQSGVQVTFLAAVAAGKTSPGFSGTASREAALAAILQGTGLSFSFPNAATVSISAADGAAATVEGAIALDMIDVSGGGTQAAADLPYQTPGSSAFISRDDIERFPGTSPGDIFKGTAGVMVGDARNSGAIDVNIRGMQGYGRTVVTIDGAQQSSSTDRGYYGDANRTFIDPDLLSGVTITKGPSNDPSSSGAIGGHVAMTTLTANDVVKPGETWGLRIRGGLNTNSSSPPPTGTVGGIEPFAGSYLVDSNIPGYPIDTVPSTSPAYGRPGLLDPTGRNGSFALATKQENFELVAAMAYRENGNYYAGTNGNYAKKSVIDTQRSEFVADQSFVDLWDIYVPGSGVKVGDTLYTQYDAYWNQGLSDYRAGEEVLNTSSQSSSGLLKGTFRLDEENTVELGYLRNTSVFGFIWPSAYKFIARPEQAPLSEVAVDTLTGKYKYKPQDNDAVDLSLNVWLTQQSLDETTTYTGLNYINAIDSDSRIGGFDLSNTSKIAVGSGHFTLAYGVAYLDETSVLILDQIWKQNQAPGTVATYDRWRRQWDAFTDGTWKPTEWLTIEAGARYTTVTTGSQTDLAPKGGNAPATSTSIPDRTNDGVVPNTSLTLEPLKGLQFYGSYKEGLRVPSYKENSDFNVATGIESLRPEHAHTTEAGINLFFNGALTESDKLGFKANYFINTIDDYIMMEYAAYTNVLTTLNYDKARFAGIELSAQYDAGMLFGSASGIYYDEVELCPTPDLCHNSNSPEGIPLNDWRNYVPPKISASATAGIRLLDQKLTLAGRVNYTGARAGMPDRYVTSTSPYWRPYTTVDAFGSYKFDQDLTFEFSGENLFDIFYVDALALAQQPAPGRTLRVNLTKQF